MAEPYLSRLRAIVNRIQFPTNQDKLIQCKHFFSGAAVFVDGNIFMSFSPVGLALKLNENDCRELLTLGGSPLRYSPKAPVKKGYVVLPATILRDAEYLENLIIKSATFVKDNQSI